MPVSNSSQMMTFRLENEFLITLRTSGTEPKIKYYSEYRGDDLDGAQEICNKLASQVVEQLLEPKLNNLSN